MVRTCWSFIRTNVSIAEFASQNAPFKPDTEPGAEKWLSLNSEYARLWPNISLKKEPPADAKEWERVPDKAQYFSPNAGAGT